MGKPAVPRFKLILYLAAATIIGFGVAYLVAWMVAGRACVKENLAGTFLALLNSIAGLLIKKNAPSLEFRKFILRLMLAGLRTFILLGVIVACWKFSGLQVFPFTLSVIFPYFIFMILEISVYYAESKKNLSGD